MIVLLLAVLIGVIAGLRTFTAPAAISWAAHLGWLQLGSTPLAFMGYAWTPWILTVLLFVNGKFDAAPPRLETTSVGGKFSMPGLMRTQRLVVASWREGHPVGH